MNRLSHEKRTQVLSCLLDGMSMRATSRITGVAFNTIKLLLIQAGEVAADYHDTHVRNVHAEYVECDEIWSFVYAKDKTVEKKSTVPDDAGSIWTWTGMDSDTKLMISYLIGGRGLEYCRAFMVDLAGRITTRPQLATDGHGAYEEAIRFVFGRRINYVQDMGPGMKIPISGAPNMARSSTAYVERQNLTMRMCMRRFTRRTNAFSKRACRHVSMICLYFLYYNFCRIHQSLRVTPAMEAGIDSVLHDVEWIAGLVEKAYPEPGPRGSYRKRT